MHGFERKSTAEVTSTVVVGRAGCRMIVRDADSSRSSLCSGLHLFNQVALALWLLERLRLLPYRSGMLGDLGVQLLHACRQSRNELGLCLR